MKLKKEELLEELKKYTGERTDDETLKLIEDVSDTVDTDGNGEDVKDWKAAYDDLAKKYKERFTEKVEEKTEEEKDEDDGEEEKAEKIKTEDLFKEEK